MNENPEGVAAPLTPAPEAAAPAPAPAPEAAAPVATDAAPAVAVPKKKKTGIIIGSIIGALVLAGGVAAILVLFVFGKSGDPMTNAMAKLLNGENRNIAVSGSFDYEMMGTPLTVGYNAQFDTVAKAGVVTADLSGSFNGMDLSANVEARMAGDDSAFIKISGIRDMFTNMISQSGIQCTGTECDTYIDTMISGMGSFDPTGGMLSAIVQLDGKWIKLSGVNLTSSISLPAGLSLDGINSHKSELTEAYKKNPFIKTSTENLKITKKANTLYKISFDYEKMANFSNEVAKIFGSSETNATASQMEAAYKDAGDIYVEIDGNNNITRLYFEIPNMSTQDFTISYPANVNVAAPDDYTTSDIFNSIFQSFGGGSYSLNGGTVTDCDSETDDCIEDIDYIDSLDDLEDSSNFDWIWDDDED